MDAYGSNPSQGKDQASISLSRPDDRTAQSLLILVAEDSKTDVFLIREALVAARVEANIHVVSDGDAATRFFDATDADEDAPCPVLVLLDINLPKKSGDEVLQHLRRSRRCRHAQVLVISSSDAARDREVVAGLSVAGYFKKPSDYAEFMKLGPRVKALLDAPSPDEIAVRRQS